MVRARLAATVLLVLGIAGCSSGGDGAAQLPTGTETVKLDAAKFTTDIDNRWWPIRPGSRWVYRETDGEGNVQQIVVTATDRTKTIAGVEARVVHDVARAEDGTLVEDTYDWYAQDSDGNVWYLGEDTKAYEDGKVSTEGSWEAGVDGAQAGVIVPADPEPGLAYRQEYYAGEAEDAAEVVRLDGHETVPFGSYDGLLVTREHSPLEPKIVEQKSYARGIGQVLAESTAGEVSREVLVSFEPAR